MLPTICAIALCLPSLPQTDKRPFEGARGLVDGRVLELRGRLDREVAPAGLVLRFDTAGRLHADHEYGWLRDLVFNGEDLWTLDSAGRPYQAMGRERDRQLTLHGLVCGNWLAGQDWELADAPDGTVHAQLVGRQLKLVLKPNAEGLPQRVDILGLGRERSLIFSNWQTTEYGRYPARVELLDTGQSVAVYNFAALVLAERQDFGLPHDAGADVRFDPEAPRELEVRTIRSGHTFIRALLDGEDHGWFAFDTGATGSLLHVELARRLELRCVMEGARASGVGGTADLSVWRAESLTVGPLRWEEPILGAIDLSALERAFGVSPLAGILGADLLVHAAWEVDLENVRIRVHPPDHGIEAEDWVPIRLYEGQLIAPVRVEGHNCHFILDTGGGGPLKFNAPTVERLRLTDGRRLSDAWARGTGGRVRVSLGTIKHAVFGGREHSDLQATFGTFELPGSWLDPYIDGVMGIAFLRPRPVLFDYPQRRVGLLARDG